MLEDQRGNGNLGVYSFAAKAGRQLGSDAHPSVKGKLECRNVDCSEWIYVYNGLIKRRGTKQAQEISKDASISNHTKNFVSIVGLASYPLNWSVFCLLGPGVRDHSRHEASQ